MGNASKPNYEAKLRKAVSPAPHDAIPGAAPQIRVAHFETCGIFAGHPCSCDPLVTVVDLKAPTRRQKNPGKSA